MEGTQYFKKMARVHNFSSDDDDDDEDEDEPFNNNLSSLSKHSKASEDDIRANNTLAVSQLSAIPNAKAQQNIIVSYMLLNIFIFSFKILRSTAVDIFEWIFEPRREFRR